MNRGILEDVIVKKDTKELWTLGYRPALPLTPQDFSMGGVLPAVLFMMRWGRRRGRGCFVNTYGKDASVADIANRLAGTDGFEGFDGDAERAILGDLLLAYCLENRNRATGRGEKVQRVFPTHYFSSWVDLPYEVANLRGVPELVVTTLAHQAAGETVIQGGAGHFAVGTGFSGNLLLRIFGPGTAIEGQADNARSDRFDEATSVGVDQLLAVRLGRSMGDAPLPLKGDNPTIPNQLPLAGRATDDFREDLNLFLRAYGEQVPRQSLVPMLESGLSVGLSTVFLGTARLLLEWERSGTVSPLDQQRPWPIFVDCSLGVDRDLRRASEASMDDLLRQLARVPVVMMCLKVLDQWARSESLPLPEPWPDPSLRVCYLGDLLFDRFAESRDMNRDLNHHCVGLSECLRKAGETSLTPVLDAVDLPSAWRLAEAVVGMMGQKLQFGQIRKFLDSVLMINEPNGLCRKRMSRRGEQRSLVLTNPVLDYLAHRHLVRAKKGVPLVELPVSRFVDIVRDRYGFYISDAPPGMPMASDLLQSNRTFLERRLRDMGLFVGANDAESMKRIHPRFDPVGECHV